MIDSHILAAFPLSCSYEAGAVSFLSCLWIVTFLVYEIDAHFVVGNWPIKHSASSCSTISADEMSCLGCQRQVIEVLVCLVDQEIMSFIALPFWEIFRHMVGCLATSQLSLGVDMIG